MLKALEDIEKTRDITRIVKCILADRHRITVLADVEMPTGVFVIDGRRATCIVQEMLIPVWHEGESNWTYAARLAEWISKRTSKYFAFYKLDLSRHTLKYIQHPGFRAADLYDMISEYREILFGTFVYPGPGPHIDNIIQVLSDAKQDGLDRDAKMWRAVMVNVIRGIAASGNIELSKFVKDVDGDLYERYERYERDHE